MPVDTIDAVLAALAAGTNRDPFDVLGPHHENGETVVRAFHPAARAIEIRLRATGELQAMSRRGPAGCFEVRLKADDPEVRLSPDATHLDYRLRVTYLGDHVVEIYDPYRYGRVLTDFDIHLLSQGTHLHAFQKLGAHRITV